MQCPYCSENIDDNLEVCPICGETLKQGNIHYNCPYCGEDIEYGLSSCPICGELFVKQNNQCSEEDKQESKIWLILYLIFTAIIIFLFTYFIMKSNKTVYGETRSSQISSEEQGLKKPSDYHFGVSYEKAMKNHKKPMIVLFYADWSGFCQRFMPIYEDLYNRKKNIYNFVKINVEDPKYSDVVKKYNIEAFPTVYMVNTKTDEREQLKNENFGNTDLLCEIMDNFNNPEVKVNSDNNDLYDNTEQNKIPTDYLFWIPYEKAIQDRTKPMIILFYADWCGSNEEFMPVLKALYYEHKNQFNFVKINVEDSKYEGAVKKYEISEFPTAFIVNTQTDYREELENSNICKNRNCKPKSKCNWD